MCIAGKSARQSFEELLDSMAARADSCFVCGASGQASTSGSDSEADEAEDSNGLSFTVLTSISFKDKSLCFKRGGVGAVVVDDERCWVAAASIDFRHACLPCLQFACGRCRGLRSTQRFLQFAALRIGPEHEDRQVCAWSWPCGPHAPSPHVHE